MWTYDFYVVCPLLPATTPDPARPPYHVCLMNSYWKPRLKSSVRLCAK